MGAEVAQYLCVCEGGSLGPTDGCGAVGVTGAGQRTVAVAIEWGLLAKGGVRKSERLWTLRVALHTVREREREREM